MGFPLANLLGTGAHISKGLVSAESGMQGETNHVEISAEVQPGNSGGPLLNAQGQVVGMISATINPMRVLVETGGSLPQNVNFAIKGPLLLRFLAKAGATLPATNSATKANFEETSKSLVLIRGGIVDEQRLREKPLVCTCTYFEGLRHQFLGLRILFVDVKAFRGVVRADLVKVTGRSMDSDLDHIFKEICAKALTDRDNPFDPKKRK